MITTSHCSKIVRHNSQRSRFQIRNPLHCTSGRLQLSRICSLEGSSEDTASTRQPAPPRTCSEAVTQARLSLRAYRQARADGTFPLPAANAAGMRCVHLTMELPLPVEPRDDEAGRQTGRAVAGQSSATSVPDPDLIRNSDEADFPGGVLQRFRVMRPLVERVLEGYGSSFQGLLESDYDGCGCWSLPPGATVIGPVYNTTFTSLLKLSEGGYGGRTLQDGHTIIAVNSEWTAGKDIGQFWERDLKEKADRLINDGGGWNSLYTCKMVRSSRGVRGMLFHAYPHRWRLYPSATDDASELGPCVLSSQERPTSAAILDALNTAKPAMEARARELEGKGDGSKQWWER